MTRRKHFERLPSRRPGQDASLSSPPSPLASPPGPVADWRQTLAALWPGGTLFPGAAPAAIDACEARLGARLPAELESLLLATDGATDEYGASPVWPVADIGRHNVEFRQNADFRDLYMPFDTLLFFGDAGNGDQFAYPLHGGRVERADVFVWSHETDSRSWVASSLADFLRRFAAGEIDP